MCEEGRGGWEGGCQERLLSSYQTQGWPGTGVKQLLNLISHNLDDDAQPSNCATPGDIFDAK